MILLGLVLVPHLAHEMVNGIVGFLPSSTGQKKNFYYNQRFRYFNMYAKLPCHHVTEQYFETP